MSTHNHIDEHQDHSHHHDHDHDHPHPHNHEHDHDDRDGHHHHHDSGIWGWIKTIFHLHGHSHQHGELVSDQAFIDNQQGIRTVWLALAALTITSLLQIVIVTWSGSVLLVIVIHMVRNIEIAFIEYLGKVHELGDETKALEAIENATDAVEPQTM